jgi:hypothetical protein
VAEIKTRFTIISNGPDLAYGCIFFPPNSCSRKWETNMCL